MASLYDHYVQATTCLIEDGIESPGLSDIFAEAVSLWKSRDGSPFPDDFETFFDKYLSIISELRTEASKRLYGENVQTPGLHIDLFVTSSGSKATRIRKVTLISNEIHIDEHIHLGSSFKVDFSQDSGLKVSPK
jgi:hypothetical protein